jgi:NitT/TauT family transport system substrate-binding protein
MKNLLIIPIGILLFFTSCIQNTNKRNVTIAQTGDFFLYAPLYVAKDAGIFEKNGLDVDILNTGGDEKSWASVISGNAEFSISDPTFVILTEKRGRPGMVVSSIVNGVPFWGITFNDTIKPIKNFIELENYTVATFPSPSTAYSLQKEIFERYNLEPKIRQGSFGTLIPMLKAKQADIALELEPNVSQQIENGAHIVYSLADLYSDFAITGLSTTLETIRDDPELVRDVVCSIQEALDYIHENRDSTVLILINRFPEISPKVAEEALSRVINNRIIPVNSITSQISWEKAVSLRVKIGDISDPKSFNSYIDNSFAISCNK